MYQEDIIAAVSCFGPIFIQIYGQGECPMCITALSRADVADRSHPRWRARLASVGRAQAAAQVRIADVQGRKMPNGATGEIIVRGDAVMPGYWRNPAATARALVLCDAYGRRSFQRRTAAGAAQLGTQGNRPNCIA